MAWANYLAEAGHRVTVLSVKPIVYPAYDVSLLKKLDSRVTVVRAGSSDPARVAKFLPFLAKQGLHAAAKDSAARRLLFPDSKIGFVRPAWRKLKQLLADRNTILITTSPPVSSHLLGLRAKAASGCRWVADWRDIWGSEPAAGDEKFKVRAEALIGEIIDSADLLTATSPKTVEYWKSLTGRGHCQFLPNGYDESDFSEPCDAPRSSIGIYGTINHLTGIERVLEWLQAYSKHHGGELEIRHTGQMQIAEFDRLLDQCRLADSWHSDGFLPHYESVQQIRAKRVNLIALSDRLDTSYAIPSRLFELLRAEPPLIAIFPKDSAARHLLEQHAFESVTLVDNQQQFVDAVGDAFQYSSSAKRTGVELFERGNQLRELEASLMKL
jgi:hypothetical protein